MLSVRFLVIRNLIIQILCGLLFFTIHNVLKTDIYYGNVQHYDGKIVTLNNKCSSLSTNHCSGIWQCSQLLCTELNTNMSYTAFTNLTCNLSPGDVSLITRADIINWVSISLIIVISIFAPINSCLLQAFTIIGSIIYVGILIAHDVVIFEIIKISQQLNSYPNIPNYLQTSEENKNTAMIVTVIVNTVLSTGSLVSFLYSIMQNVNN